VAGLIMSADRPSLPLTGGCSWGAIRYEITSFPLLLYTCNCTNCQTASGSAFALNMPVWAKDFHVLQGQPKPWRHISPTGVPVISWFCNDCGGRVYGDRTGREEIANLRAGTLDDMAGPGSAYVHEERASVGSAGRRCRVSRDRAERFSIGGQGVARDVVGILSADIEREAFHLGVAKVLAVDDLLARTIAEHRGRPYKRVVSRFSQPPVLRLNPPLTIPSNNPARVVHPGWRPRRQADLEGMRDGF
jgi:hypothetical protein